MFKDSRITYESPQFEKYHQIDVAAVFVSGEQLLYDVSDAAHEPLLAAPGRVAVFKVDVQLKFSQIMTRMLTSRLPLGFFLAMIVEE